MHVIKFYFEILTQEKKNVKEVFTKNLRLKNLPCTMMEYDGDMHISQ